MPFSSLKSTFEIIMQLNCVWMFWHSECESRGLGRLPCCTWTVMSPQAGSLRVSFITLSMPGYCSRLNRQLTSNRRSPLSSGTCVPCATGLCLGDARTAGLLWRLPRSTGQSGVFPMDEASASEMIRLPVPRKVWDEFLPLPHGCPAFSVKQIRLWEGERRDRRCLGRLAVCPALQ